MIGSVGSNVTTYSSKNLIQTTEYYYRVRAKSGSTYSTYTDEASATALPMNPPGGLHGHGGVIKPDRPDVDGQFY